MAAGSNLTKFYVFLGVVVIAGGALMLTQSGNADPSEILDVTPVATGDFAGYTIGSDSAPVEVIEYADFQCPACARHAILTMPDVMQRLVATGRVKWTFRDFPLDIHPKSPAAHLSAACAGEQGKFWEMHDQLFYNQNDWAFDRRHERRFEEYAETIGLDMDRYDSCFSERRHAGRIVASLQRGAQAGVGSTPSFVIGGRLYPGAMPYDQFKAIIDSVAGVE